MSVVKNPCHIRGPYRDVYIHIYIYIYIFPGSQIAGAFGLGLTSVGVRGLCGPSFASNGFADPNFFDGWASSGPVPEKSMPPGPSMTSKRHDARPFCLTFVFVGQVQENRSDRFLKFNHP